LSATSSIIPDGIAMNTAVARPLDVPRAAHARVAEHASRFVHEIIALVRVAWEGVCSVSKASLPSLQQSEHAYRRRMRRL
jgi:hypothetical protein